MKCSFCGKEIDPGSNYITGATMNVHMCAECFSILYNKYSEVTENMVMQGACMTEQTDTIKNVTPSKIKAELDKHIVGQEEAKKIMCTAIYNHYKRINQSDNNDGVTIDKSNICLIGPTGTGKTEIARSIAKLLDVPFAICDATTITQSGYVGEDIESIITRVLQNCDYDVDRAEHAIIVLDEVDKLRKSSGNTSITRDVSGEGVQQGLLKMLEGTDAMVPPQGGRKHPEQKLIKVNTKNILFILTGAFVGLEEIIEKRHKEEDKKLNKNTSSIGFNAVYSKIKESGKSSKSGDENGVESDKVDKLSDVQHDDIIKYGMIPEIVGRMPVIAHTLPLDKDALKCILTEPANAIIKQYKKLLRASNVELGFTAGAIDFIADKASEMGTGARALRTCMEKVMSEPMFSAPDLGLAQKNPYIMKITKTDCVKALGKIQQTADCKNKKQDTVIGFAV